MAPTAAQLLAFIEHYLGVANTGNTADNRGQCTGLVQLWLAVNGHANIWGNAKDLLANAPQTVYRVVENTPVNFPSWGDIVCWDGSWGAGFGHCAVVVAATEMLLAVFEQNNPEGSPPLLATHDYQGVQGWIVLP